MTTAKDLYPDLAALLFAQHEEVAEKLSRYMHQVELHTLAEAVDSIRVIDIERPGIVSQHITPGSSQAETARVNLREWARELANINIWLTDALEAESLPPSFDEAIGRLDWDQDPQ